QFRHELTYAIGFAIPFWTDDADARTHLDGHIQMYGSSAFALFGEREGTALEAVAGIKLFHSSGVVGGIAMGPGLNRGFGSPDFRLIVNLGWMMPRDLPNGDRDGDGILDADDECPDEPEDMDEFEDENGCPDPDNDQDGILDDPDECPNEPENRNDFEDEDGCPDEIGDTDGDGYLDNVDECVDSPEDFDGFEDENGCPDPDNDEDGIVDTSDDCPLEPGPVENHGCPDADRDGDTVVDRMDNCPDEPGPPENHGCQEEQQVVLQEGRLEILDMVYFQTNRATILSRSFPLLQNVARVLNAHPEITRVRVEGHTDSRGRYERNMTLSQQRAESVVTFLVTRGGVDRSRLEAQGFGPNRPVVENASTPDQHAQNRRVEFNIPSEAGISQRRSGAGDDTIDR
ncbi:MAG: OmpA family protein, partial [Myxococcales bacterium]|nr:OmpA family protein [Myxococcales bacterium]